MGYYSEVGLALTAKGVTELHKLLERAEIELAAREEIKGFLGYADHHYTDTDTKAEVWHWKTIKWYTCDPQYYPAVDFLDKPLSTLDEDEFRFIRIGEDYDDTEVRGYFWENPFDLELARSITIRSA